MRLQGVRGDRQEMHWRTWDRGSLVEIGEAILLALVAVATAWTGYQAARWDGESAKLYGTSSRIRIEATQADTRGGQEQLYDASTFSFWLEARLKGEAKLAAEYEGRFRPEYRPAFQAWLATHPFTNPDAPAGPMLMPQYRNGELEQAARLNTQASGVFAQGAHARTTGDRYVRATVLLATVLFLLAVSQRFRHFRVRVGLLCVAVVILAYAIGTIATYPRF
jgi:hypothetical protein